VAQITDFLKLLFGNGDWQTCFAPDAKGTEVFAFPDSEDLFFSINELDAHRDHNPTESYHRMEKPRRADHNVVCFRNFLLELDDMPLDRQVQYMNERLPWTSAVYSGGKSVHFIISLEEPLASEADYREVAERLHMLAPAADPACKNPSRLSRLPGRIRRDTGKEQALLQMWGRVPNADLFALLPPLPTAEATPLSNDKRIHDFFSFVNAPDDGIRKLGCGGRNAFFYWLGNRLKDVGADSASKRALVEKAYANLQRKSGFSLREALAAARVSK
jgi:hypothetical protein